MKQGATDFESVMESMDITVSVVEVFTGYRNGFIASGWSPQGAERMVIEILRSNGGKS